MVAFSRFESGKAFKLNATKATGKPIAHTQPPKGGKYPNVTQRPSKAPVTLPVFKSAKPT
jgi:hypothetical protein